MGGGREQQGEIAGAQLVPNYASAHLPPMHARLEALQPLHLSLEGEGMSLCKGRFELDSGSKGLDKGDAKQILQNKQQFKMPLRSTNLRLRWHACKWGHSTCSLYLDSFVPCWDDDNRPAEEQDREADKCGAQDGATVECVGCQRREGTRLFW